MACTCCTTSCEKPICARREDTALSAVRLALPAASLKSASTELNVLRLAVRTARMTATPSMMLTMVNTVRSLCVHKLRQAKVTTIDIWLPPSVNKSISGRAACHRLYGPWPPCPFGQCPHGRLHYGRIVLEYRRGTDTMMSHSSSQMAKTQDYFCSTDENIRQ